MRLQGGAENRTSAYFAADAVNSPSTPNCSTVTVPVILLPAESKVPLYFTVRGVPLYSESYDHVIFVPSTFPVAFPSPLSDLQVPVKSESF